MVLLAFKGSNQMRGLSSDDKKKLRNRKASRVSRLRKKLSVYDLTRRYTALSAENREQARSLQLYRAALAAVAERLAEHEPSYRCDTLEATASSANPTTQHPEQQQQQQQQQQPKPKPKPTRRRSHKKHD